MAMGIQQFAVASLPRFVRMLVGIAGVGGNRQTGLNLLKECTVHGTITAVESRTVLSLFLRHDGRYAEAIVVQHGLATEYPHDYLFRLEEANLTKDSGNGPGAIAIYKNVLADAHKPGYFIDPRLQLAWFGLADTERGQNDIQDAAQHYLEASNQPNSSDWLRRRAQLNAGQMFDLLHQRDIAKKQYELASAGGGDQSPSRRRPEISQDPLYRKINPMARPVVPQNLKRKILKDSLRENQQRDAAFRRIIRSIPKGRVSTYGKVAAAAGYPLYHRAVARLLRHEALGTLPWQRVVGVGGEIKLRGEAAAEQRLRLSMEGVKFRGKRVDMESFEHPLRSWETSD